MEERAEKEKLRTRRMLWGCLSGDATTIEFHAFLKMLSREHKRQTSFLPRGGDETKGNAGPNSPSSSSSSSSSSRHTVEGSFVTTKTMADVKGKLFELFRCFLEVLFWQRTTSLKEFAVGTEDESEKGLWPIVRLPILSEAQIIEKYAHNGSECLEVITNSTYSAEDASVLDSLDKVDSSAPVSTLKSILLRFLPVVESIVMRIVLPLFLQHMRTLNEDSGLISLLDLLISPLTSLFFPSQALLRRVHCFASTLPPNSRPKH